ncbi:hypothetical protein LXL04_018538 [Taraxacum kok-saghyz]
MSSRKEEERNEKIIRGLMKLPPNRRCINCNSLGPQYVCTNFWTFVCMTCSGIHREFTHRVKSVSMSKFTSQEVESLQEGGNQRARETFLKDWDPREQRLPDNSNVDKVREFIKSVYVDKKFFASKASGKPPRDTLGVRNNEDETRRASSYHSYSQSPPYDYQYEERRYGKQAPSLTKKPGSDRGMLRFLSTSRLSDHVQEDDRFANDVANTKARVSDFSGTQSPTFQSEIGFSSLSREMSKDNLTEDVQKLKTGSSDTLSGKFDGLDLFSAPYAPSESEKFGGLDLFNAPIQTTTSGPSVVDLFDFSANTSQSTNDEKSQPFDSSSLDLFTVMPQQEKSTETVKEKSTDVKNDGWATFDMPWHAQVQPPTKSVTVVPETSTSEGHFGNFHQPPLSTSEGHFGNFDQSSQWSVDEGFSNHSYGIPQNNNNNNNQTWNAFEESNTHFESIYTSKQVQVQDPYLSWGISENMKMKQADVDAGSTSFVSTTPHAIPQADVLERAQSKSRNPFDFPGDDDLEATNMQFLDMSSLQSGLPNHNWFPESATAGIGMQIPNIQAQEPVASIGGNPFG